MNIRSLFVNIGKLLFCGVVFAIGTVIGRMLVTIMGLHTQARWCG